MVGGEEPAQHPDGGFEQVHILVDVEIKIVSDPVLGLSKLLLQVHYQHRVQAVDQSEIKSKSDVFY